MSINDLADETLLTVFLGAKFALPQLLNIFAVCKRWNKLTGLMFERFLNLYKEGMNVPISNKDEGKEKRRRREGEGAGREREGERIKIKRKRMKTKIGEEKGEGGGDG